MKTIISISLFFLLLSCATVKPIVFEKNYFQFTSDLELYSLQINEEAFEEAEKTYVKLSKQQPRDIRLETLHVFYLLKKKQFQEGIIYAEELLIQNKKNPLLLTLLSSLYQAIDKYEQAYEAINNSLSLNSFMPITWYQKGLLEYEDAIYNKSEMSFNRAYLLKSDLADAYFFRMLSRLMIAKKAENIKNNWTYFKNNFPNKSYHYLHLTNALYEIKYYEDAQKILNEGLDIFVNDPYLLNAKAFYLVDEIMNNTTVVTQHLPNDEKIITTEEEKIKSSLDKAEEYINLALHEQINAEFADTHLLVLELKNNKDILINEIKKYEMLFPNDKLILKWKNKRLATYEK